MIRLTRIATSFSKIKDLQSVQQYKQLLNNPAPTLLYFSADWCGPCKVTKPVIEKVVGAMSKPIDVYRIDVDNESLRTVASQHNVTSIPQLCLVGNKKVGKSVRKGTPSQQQLKELIETGSKQLN